MKIKRTKRFGGHVINQAEILATESKLTHLVLLTLAQSGDDRIISHYHSNGSLFIQGTAYDGRDIFGLDELVISGDYTVSYMSIDKERPRLRKLLLVDNRCLDQLKVVETLK